MMPGRLAGLFLLFFSLPLSAGELVLSSGDKPGVLMELYTSEGCSSCPPLERYLNEFKSDDALWKPYIPLAFHVDYWNYIGWEDRFAAPEFAERQRGHARERHVSSVYTPSLIVNGTGWRPGFLDALPPVASHPTGKLEVRVSQDTLTADFTPLAEQAPALDLHIALLGMDLVSRITAGENKGRTSRHEFVVIGFKSVSGPGGHWQTRLPDLHYPDAEFRALAVWVTPARSLRPLQAVGGYLN